ncbi:hypothetical protein FOZ63_028739, partial [Perkinsus olseni]
ESSVTSSPTPRTPVYFLAEDGGVMSSLTTLAEDDGEEGPLTYGMNEKPSRCPLHLRITIRPATSDKSDGQSVTARNANDSSLVAGVDSEAVIQRLVQDVLNESSLTELIRAGIGSQTVAPLIEGSLSPRPAAPKVAEDALWNVVPWEMTEDGALLGDEPYAKEDERGGGDGADDEMRTLLRNALSGDVLGPACDSELLLLRKGWAGSDAWGSVKQPGRSLEEAVEAQKMLLTEGTGWISNSEELSKFSNEALKKAVLSAIEEQLRCDRSSAGTTEGPDGDAEFEVFPGLPLRRVEFDYSTFPGLQVRASGVVQKQLGLFTTKCFPEGSLICEYSGRLLSLAQTLKARDRSYIMGGFGINCHIDAKYSFNVWGRYINDCKDSNRLNAKFVKDKKRRVAKVVATRDIPAGSEVLASYGEVYWRSEERFNRFEYSG